MFGFLNPYMLWIKIGIAALGAIAIFGAGMTVQGWRKDMVISDLNAEHAKEKAASATLALNQLQKFIAGMQVSVVDYEKSQGTLFKRLDGISKELKNVQINAPLPDNCRPDAERLRQLAAAVTAANDATASGWETGPALRGTNDASSP